jgi:hypothetical protein
MRLYPAFAASYIAFLVTGAISPVHAAVWNYGTQIGLSSDWNDNPALANDTVDTESTFRFLASYDGNFERRSYDKVLSFRPTVTTDYYTDSQFSNLQTTNFFLPGSFSIQRPTRQWALGFNASQQSVLSNEESISQGATASLLGSDDTVTQLSLSPGLTWIFSEQDEFSINLDYAITDYDLDFTDRTDSSTIAGVFSYRRSLNERNTLGMTALYSSSDADRKTRVPVEVVPPTDPPTFQIEEGKIDVNSSSSFVTADYTYVVNEISSLRMSYGLQAATTDSVTSINSTGARRSTGELTFDSTTYNIEYSSEGPRSNFSIAAIRTVTLDITSGQPQDRDEARLRGNYSITNRLTGSWRIVYWQQEPVALIVLDENNTPINFRNEQKFVEAETGLSWNLTTKWYLDGRYQYRQRTNDQTFGNRNLDLEAVSNNITIGIRYLWKEIPR